MIVAKPFGISKRLILVSGRSVLHCLPSGWVWEVSCWSNGSPVSQEVHAGFCERLGLKCPGRLTQQWQGYRSIEVIEFSTKVGFEAVS